NPSLDCKVELDYEGVSPMYGGEYVREDGEPIAIDPEKSFAKAHYEQHMAAKGSFVIGDDTFVIEGFGLRDKSWGPRYWQAINWYRWCPMNFGRDFGMMLSIVAGSEGKPREGGMVFKDGIYVQRHDGLRLERISRPGHRRQTDGSRDMKIDLWDPESFAHGHPHAQYDWLRANDPVHFQEEPNGPGYWAITRYQD